MCIKTCIYGSMYLTIFACAWVQIEKKNSLKYVTCYEDQYISYIEKNVNYIQHKRIYKYI